MSPTSWRCWQCGERAPEINELIGRCCRVSPKSPPNSVKGDVGALLTVECAAWLPYAQELAPDHAQVRWAVAA